MLAEHAVDGGTGDQVALGQLTEALAALTVVKDGGAIENKRLPSDVPAFQFGAAHPGPYPLDDQVALQLGDSADDDHNRAAQRPSGVDLFAEADELDVQPVQLIQHLKEVLHGPGDRSEAQTRMTSN